MSKPMLFTGIRPTGELHLGHYFSIIEPMVKRQKDHQIVIMIADLHSLTSLRKACKNIMLHEVAHDISTYTDEIINVLSRFIKIDNENVIIFRQSDLREYHYDLFYKLMMISRHSMTFGNPIFSEAMIIEYEREVDLLKLDIKMKDLIKQFIHWTPEILWGNISERIGIDLKTFLIKKYNELHRISIEEDKIDKIIRYLNTRIGVIGLASYPILMAADIILHNPEYVIVGSDQIPHMQITNDLVDLLNKYWDLLIRQPKGVIIHSKTVKGSDGRKMSKSYGNHLSINDLFDDDSGVFFNKIKTYSRKREDTGIPSRCLVGEYFNLFNLTNNCLDLCKVAQIGCVECKSILRKSIMEFISTTAIFKSSNHENLLIDGANIMKERINNNTILRKLLLI